MLLWATTRKGQLDANLQAVQNPEHDLVSNNQEGPARCWLTNCLKPRTCSCQHQPGRTNQMLTYRLFKTKSMLLSGTSRKGQPALDLHTVQNPEHALVSNNQEEPAKYWLTSCSKPRASCCQQQVERASQMLTYRLFKTRTSSYQQQPGRASQMLTYILLKTQSKLLSGTTRMGQPNADLQTIQNPKHALVSNKHDRPARCWLTLCSKPRACFGQQHVWKANQMLTYSLFKTQSMLFSATGGKGQPDADLQTVQNPEHAIFRNNQEGTARCWLTSCSKPRACSS